jgi:hypothetical protein
MEKSEFDKILDVAQPRIEEFDRLYKSEYGKTDEDIARIYENINQVLTYGFVATFSRLVNRKGGFHVFGCDVMLDANLKPWFLEVNTYPALHEFTNAKKEVMPQLGKSTIDIVMHLHDNWDNFDDAIKNIAKFKGLGRY